MCLSSSNLNNFENSSSDFLVETSRIRTQSAVFDDAASICGGDVTQLYCTTKWGGYFDKNLSSSWSQAASFESLHIKAVMPDDYHQNVSFSTDTMYSDSTLALQKYLLRLERGSVESSNVQELGFARNSTLLNAPSMTGSVASIIWSYFHGWNGGDTQYKIDAGL